MHILECKIHNGLISVFYAWLKPLIAVAKWVEILFEGEFSYLCSLLLQSVNQRKNLGNNGEKLRMPLPEKFLTHCMIVWALNLGNSIATTAYIGYNMPS